MSINDTNKNRKKGERKLCQEDIFEVKKILKDIEVGLAKINSIIYGHKKDSSYNVDTKNAKEYIEGVFDGKFMIDDDNEKYLVPENYASKSKLVEGDVLKLVITPNGTYVFKQISPIERTKKTGKLGKKGDGYTVKVGEDEYKVIKASVTYYKINVGDRVTIIVPKDKKSKWAAIENKII